MTPSEVVVTAIQAGLNTTPSITDTTFYSYDTIASAVRRLREAGVVKVTGTVQAPRRPLILALELTGKPLHQTCTGCLKTFEVTALNHQQLCTACRKESTRKSVCL